MEATIKKHSKNEFYVKKIRGGFFCIINGYDNSMESIESMEEAAYNLCNKLNEMRNKRLGLN